MKNMADVRLFVRVISLFVLILVQSCLCAKSPRITSLYACTDIKYRFATTRITSHVINPTNQSRQAVFDITLPNDAFISNFTLTVNGTTYPGRVEERAEALRRFNSSQWESSAGKVTQSRRETNQFRVTLKVAPFQGVTFNLTYQEILERRLGYYDHVLYIDPGQPVEDLRVDVSIEENREITYLHVPPIRTDLLFDFDVSERNSLVRVERPSDRQAYVSYHPTARHQQLQSMSRDGLSGLFTVRYDVSRTMDAGELLSINGYFVHFIAPPVQDPIPKDVLFILDTSTSMMWEKLGQLQDAMRVILNDLVPGDRFALMQFNSRATFWRRELLPVTPRTIQWAMEYVQSLKARGYTNIDAALTQGMDFFNEDATVKGNNSLIIFLTDGRPTRGETDRAKILKHVRAENRKKVAVYGLAFGKDADWPLVKRAALQNHGIGRRIYQDADAALQIQGFYDEVSTLLLTGVQAVYLDSEVDAETLTRTLFLKFFNGSELVVAGKLIRLNQTALQVFVQATGHKGQVNLTVVPDPDPLTPGRVKSCGLLEAGDLTGVVEKMWAYITIRQMLQKRVGEDDKLTKQNLKKQATDLALRYNFVTPVTSMVVSKPGTEELAFLQEDTSDLLDETDPWVSGENATNPISSHPSTKSTTDVSYETSSRSASSRNVHQTSTTQTSHRIKTSPRPTDVSHGLQDRTSRTKYQDSATETKTSPTPTSEKSLPQDSTVQLETSPKTETSSTDVQDSTIIGSKTSPTHESTSSDNEGSDTQTKTPTRFTSKSTVSQDGTRARTSSIEPSGETPSPLTELETSTTSDNNESFKKPQTSKTSSLKETPVPEKDGILSKRPGSSEGSAGMESASSEEVTAVVRRTGAQGGGSWPRGTVLPEMTTDRRGPGLPDRTTGNRSTRGGGGGDPHFMVEMASLSYPLCFDIRGNTGDVFRLLRDPQSGLTVNVEIGQGHLKLPGSTRLPVYIRKAAILLQDVITEVTTTHVQVNGVSLQWGTKESVYVPGVWVMMNNSNLRFALDWSVEIDVTRHVKNATNQRGESFLNVEIQNEAKLSKESSGLLGQFVHKDVRLERIKKRDGRLVAELEIRDSRGGHWHTRHGRALLKNRKDPYFRRQSTCLMVDNLWSHTLDTPTRFYKVRSLHEI